MDCRHGHGPDQRHPDGGRPGVAHRGRGGGPDPRPAGRDGRADLSGLATTAKSARPATGARSLSYGGRQSLLVVELLRRQSLDENIAVVKGVEINLDDISIGVVDPHVLNSNLEL